MRCALLSLSSSNSSHSVWSAKPVNGRLTRAEDPGANKWYQSRTSTVAGLTAGDDGWFGDVRQQRRCCGYPAMTGGRRAHGAGGQRHQLADADSHQLWRVGVTPSVLRCTAFCENTA